MRAAIMFIPLFAGLVACMPMKDAVSTPTGADDYADMCATCHGPAGRGDGEVARDLGVAAPDLTQLAALNGGVFPKAQVMSQIYGYARDGHGGSDMPAFGELLEGETVLVDTGDGIATPTPLRLVQLAEYLEALGR
ncbi:c-type cytochrome [Phaeovulum sp. NW3]|uniref:c-type cytochrome n=1 Tax=Phaeovulum sp. NW3 TaxID=2934933 RepID=UPI00202018F6|nr:c-type cytochrome [Phaeovulum sp. NW3]MCL7465603.1 cytochrome c [Phaeovulum sp. NW3]